MTIWRHEIARLKTVFFVGALLGGALFENLLQASAFNLARVYSGGAVGGALLQGFRFFVNCGFDPDLAQFAINFQLLQNLSLLQIIVGLCVFTFAL